MNLSNIDLLSLQPSYFQEDKFIKALCKALNPYFQSLSDNTKVVYIYGRIDELDVETLDSLAWQFHVDFYDYTLSIEKKRKLIKDSLKLHKIKGTPKAVEDMATTIFGKTKLKEWFEYNGKPFFFGLDVDVTERGASPSELKKLETLINAYKNKRSWIDYLNIFLTNEGKTYIGTITICGEEITVYPWSPKDIQTKGEIKIPISQAFGIENITIYPKED